MFQPWRIKLQEAKEAFRGGRLDDAGQLLAQSDLARFLPAQQLSVKVAERLVQRGQSRVALGDTSAGWHDLQVASRLGADATLAAKLRQQLVDHGLAETRRYLSSGDHVAALSRLDTLEQHGATGENMRLLRQLARHLDEAQRLSRRGDFVQAEYELQTAAALDPGLEIVQQRLQLCRASKIEARDCTQRLHEALHRQRWTEVLAAAEQLLELAPECPIARDAHRRAWLEVGAQPALTNDHANQPNQNQRPRRVAVLPPAAPAGEVRSAMKPRVDDRFLLWVDGVGGYLVCMSDEVVLGPPAPGSGVDVPILADLSRKHATIRREGENYLICPGRDVRLDGKALQSPTPVFDGSVIELGSSVQVRFRRPHPLSSTARLEFVSRHRTQPSVDAVILMAQSCILGPKDRNHIYCPDWSADLVLHRQGNELRCRGKGPMNIDGVMHAEGGELTHRSRVSGEDYTFSLEPV